jgi:GTP cyclohydrolase I
VARAYEEFFSGYARDAHAELARTFEDIQGYDDMVLVKDIAFTAHCEHHIVPIIGRAHVAYWPAAHVVGISKLARVVDIFARRLISQETMTRQIAGALDAALKPRGSAVLIEAAHQCMTTRGVAKAESATVTAAFTGVFKADAEVRGRFMACVGGRA